MLVGYNETGLVLGGCVIGCSCVRALIESLFLFLSGLRSLTRRTFCFRTDLYRVTNCEEYSDPAKEL